MKENSSQKQLLKTHQDLMFNLVFPKNSIQIKKTEKILSKLVSIIKEKSRQDPETWEGTGFWGSEINHSFTFPVVSWLLEKFPNFVEIIFEDDELSDDFNTTISMLITSMEEEGFHDTELTTKAWLEIACGDKKIISWLIDFFVQLDVNEQVRNYLFEKLDIYINWKLDLKSFSLSYSRFPLKRTFFHSKGLLTEISPDIMLSKKLPSKRKLSKSELSKIIDCCKFSIYSRCREIDTLNSINEKDTSLFQLERGYDLFLFGIKPKHRLGLNCYQGFVLAKNSIPIAYGGGWVLFNRCEIGVNIFEEFRGGESRYAFLQILRTYKKHFNISQFTVDPYQFGRDNQEAIASGAFWFYYRLGFRPKDMKLQQLAINEDCKIKESKKYRTPNKVLKQLAKGELELNFKAISKEINVVSLSLKVSHWIGRKFSGDHSKAWQYLYSKLSKILDLSHFENWNDNEKESFRSLAPLVFQIKELKSWSIDEKQNLCLLMKAKGANHEKKFVLMCQKHQRFREALASL